MVVYTSLAMVVEMINCYGNGGFLAKIRRLPEITRFAALK